MKSLGRRADGLRLERMRASPLWAETGFRNRAPIQPGLRDTAVPMPTLREFLRRGERRVPDSPLPMLDPRQTWLSRPDTGLRTTWLGHSTVLIELDGYRVLTDPVWGPRASPSVLVGPKRFQPMPVSLREMPEVDLIVISHDHYDHLDYPTIKVLAKSRVPFVTSLGVGAHLQAWGIEPDRIHELDWWESFALPGTGLSVTAAPSQHFSGRTLKSRNATLWSSLVIRGPRHAAFFSGDTGLTDQYSLIRDRLGPFDLVMLEVGAFHPAWGDIHLGPDHALEAAILLERVHNLLADPLRPKNCVCSVENTRDTTRYPCVFRLAVTAFRTQRPSRRDHEHVLRERTIAAGPLGNVRAGDARLGPTARSLIGDCASLWHSACDAPLRRSRGTSPFGGRDTLVARCACAATAAGAAAIRAHSIFRCHTDALAHRLSRSALHLY